VDMAVATPPCFIFDVAVCAGVLAIVLAIAAPLRAVMCLTVPTNEKRSRFWLRSEAGDGT
jgi:hypothetical protein